MTVIEETRLQVTWQDMNEQSPSTDLGFTHYDGVVAAGSPAQVDDEAMGSAMGGTNGELAADGRVVSRDDTGTPSSRCVAMNIMDELAADGMLARRPAVSTDVAALGSAPKRKHAAALAAPSSASALAREAAAPPRPKKNRGLTSATLAVDGDFGRTSMRDLAVPGNSGGLTAEMLSSHAAAFHSRQDGFYVVIEFQRRGLPHAHIFSWA
jgi:hypothetical protein